MARREPVPEQVRAAILERVRAGGVSCRAVAREFELSPTTVSRIATAAGLSFERAQQTAKAVTARRFDAKAARAQAITELYALSAHLRGRVQSPYTHVVNGRGGPELLTTKLPPLREAQAGLIAAAVALDKALALERFDTDDGTAVGKTMLNDLFGAMQLRHHREVVETDA